ncbi:hypothetical protein CLV67_11676 [Actinoplanes italicus]|uniref:Uncharacterized protein n=1 Tax=Actinoplanes italicus TaxID=113567 RepID=A0A2T0K3U8_9ACTN|nr:hypothetical protein CLV67_11676 [Actinoplanes italicus]
MMIRSYRFCWGSAWAHDAVIAATTEAMTRA